MKALICICLLAMFLVLGCVQTPVSSPDANTSIDDNANYATIETDKTIPDVTDATVGKAITKFDLIEDVSEVEIEDVERVEAEETDANDNETNEVERRLLGSHRSDMICTDTDGGRNYTRRGTTVSFNNSTRVAETKTDKCVLGGMLLTEYYCASDRNIISYLYPCSCSDGACNPPSPRTCTDSDNGKNYSRRGTTISSNATESIEETDSCLAGRLVEYYCRLNNMTGSETHDCPEGCSYGKCNPAVINSTIITSVPSPTTCVDSDGGNNSSRRGTTNVMSGTRIVETRTDYCSGNRVVEYLCRSSSIISVSLTCRNGCSDGRCNPEPVVTSTTDSVVVFDSPGQRRLLIINDLNPTTETLAGITVTVENTVASIRIGQTQSSLGSSSTEVLESMDFACVESGSFAMVDTIDADGSKRGIDPSTLSASGSDNSYRYFTIPSSLTTPYWLRVLYGEWYVASSTTATCFDKISTRVVNCAGNGTVIKYFDIPVTSHPNGKTIALKMSGFLPDGTFYGETYYCGLYGG
ncbi:MAG: hypothetical protein Q7S22_03570 [Candidatus Micrarchaeota archaeon]|nr:hypothetical protein [Candidatus Micrarchaeota archaeon]